MNGFIATKKNKQTKKQIKVYFSKMFSGVWQLSVASKKLDWIIWNTIIFYWC